MVKVLLIEDNEDDREIYRALLYYNGFDVLTASDGMEGVRLANQHHPDAIVLDVMLPGVSGLVTAQRIHHSADTADVPIICMSAHDVNINMVKHSGALEFLPKPVSGDVLVRAIRKYVGWEEDTDQAPTRN
jgi:DNA-binding response OmpR family regulator